MLPNSLTQGENLELSLYDTDTTEVVLYIKGEASYTFNLTCELSDCTWELSEPTIDIIPGDYFYEIWGSDSLIDKGRIKILPSVKNTKDFDGKTDAEKNLIAINDFLSKKSFSPYKRKKINELELEHYNIKELLDLKSHFSRIVASEKRKSKGLPPMQTIRFNF